MSGVGKYHSFTFPFGPLQADKFLSDKMRQDYAGEDLRRPVVISVPDFLEVARPVHCPGGDCRNPGVVARSETTRQSPPLDEAL